MIKTLNVLSDLRPCGQRMSQAKRWNAWFTQVEGSHSYILARKLDATKKELKKSNKEWFGQIKEIIKSIESKIASLQDVEPTKENLKLEAALSLDQRGNKIESKVEGIVAKSWETGIPKFSMCHSQEKKEKSQNKDKA